LYCGSEPRGLIRGSSPADRCGARVRSRVVWCVGARRRSLAGSGAAWFGTWELAGGSLAGSEPRGLVRGSSSAIVGGVRSRVVWYVGARRRIVGGVWSRVVWCVGVRQRIVTGSGAVSGAVLGGYRGPPVAAARFRLSGAPVPFRISSFRSANPKLGLWG
jgi:hypothetical protein